MLYTWAPQDFLQGGQGGDGSPPAGSRGGAPVGVWGRSPPEADGIVLNKDTQTLFPVRRHHLQVVREFYCTTFNPPGGLGDGNPQRGPGAEPQKLTA